MNITGMYARFKEKKIRRFLVISLLCRCETDRASSSSRAVTVDIRGQVRLNGMMVTFRDSLAKVVASLEWKDKFPWQCHDLLEEQTY